MTIEELEELKNDLRSVRRAVQRHSPLFREIAATDFYARLSLPYAAVIIAFGALTQVLLGTGSDYRSLPAWWFPALWVFLALVFVAGGAVKINFLSKRAATKGVSYLQIVAAIWGSEGMNSILSAVLALVGVSAFAISLGHPWYVLPVSSTFFGLALNNMGHVVRRLEYYLAGWYGVASATVSLFFLEAAPWAWLAVTFGGMLLVFGLGAFIPARDGSGRKGARRGEAEE